MNLTEQYAKEHGLTLNAAKRILRHMRAAKVAAPFVQPPPVPKRPHNPSQPRPDEATRARWAADAEKERAAKRAASKTAPLGT